MEKSDTPKSKSWMKYLLIASLGVNLLIAGLFVGAMVGGDKRTPSRLSQNVGIGMLPYVKPLPEDERKVLFKQFRELKPHRREAFQSLRSQNSEILSLIRSEDFTKEALTAAFDRQHGVIADVLSKGRSGLIEVVAGMSLEERKAYADRVEQELKNKSKRKKDRSKRQPD